MKTKPAEPVQKREGMVIAKRQMKFLGATWVRKGNTAIGYKMLLEVKDLEWLLERAKHQEGKRVTIWTHWRKFSRPSNRSPTHTNVVFVYEGEWGWEEGYPVEEVDMTPGHKRMVVKGPTVEEDPFSDENLVYGGDKEAIGGVIAR